MVIWALKIDCLSMLTVSALGILHSPFIRFWLAAKTFS